MKRLVLVLVASFALAGVGVAAADDVGAPNNVVVADVSTGGTTLARSATEAAGFDGAALDSKNDAYATAHDCARCYASAVAVQVVLVHGSPTTITPQNVGLAVNQSCTDCGSFAYAWQYVVQVPGHGSLSPDARHRVNELRHEIADETASVVPTDLATDQALAAKLNALTAQLKSVVDSDLQAHGQHGHGDVHKQVREQDD